LGLGPALIVLTVLIHVLGLGLIRQRVTRFSIRSEGRHHPTVVFVLVMGTTTLLATTLHALETGLWAGAYRLLALCPTTRTRCSIR